MISEISLWLFVIFSGIAVGAGLYEIRVELPQWFVSNPGTGLAIHADLMNKADSGRRFWGFITTGPLTLLTILSLVLAWPQQTGLQSWWFIAAAVALVERIGTLSFFIPQAIKLMQGGDAAIAARRAARWISLNRVRAGLAFASWVLALKALTQL
jgi:hypothetical protein